MGLGIRRRLRAWASRHRRGGQTPGVAAFPKDAETAGTAQEEESLTAFETPKLIDAVFRLALGRPAEEEAMAHYGQALEGGLARSQFALSVLTSPEGRRQAAKRARAQHRVSRLAAHCRDILLDLGAQPEALHQACRSVDESFKDDPLKRVETDYRKNLVLLQAEISIQLEEASTGTTFRLVGPASDQSVFIRVVHRQGRWEPDLARFVAGALSEGDTFMDVGANLGFFTALAAKRVGAWGKVLSFEAHPRTRHFLQRTIEENGIQERVCVHPIAVWNERKTLQFRDSDTSLGGNHVVADNDASGSLSVKAHPLDAYLDFAELEKLKLIKMDIEGAEPQALLGMKTLLERTRVPIVTEFNPHCLKLLGNSTQTFWNACSTIGYRVCLIEGPGKAIAIQHPEELDARTTQGQLLELLLEPHAR